MGKIVGGVLTAVEQVAFDDYVARAMAARWSADLPPAALEVGAIVTRQAAWYMAIHAHEAYMLSDGTCFDVRDDASDLVLASLSAVQAPHRTALAATASLTLRQTRLAEPFFLPLVQEGNSDTCSPGPVSPSPIVPRRGVVACAAIAGEGARTILHRYLDPGLTILDSSEIGGATRYETAVAASRAAHPTAPAGTVFVATGLNFPDSLAGGPAAAMLGGSLLLVPGTTLPSAVAVELQRLKPAAIRVLGGPGVVSDGVLVALRAFSPNVARVYGQTRYETALAISRLAFAPGREHVFVATGANFPDALAGASAGAFAGGPVLLVPGGAPGQPFASALEAELRRLAPRAIHVLGGSAVVSAETLTWLKAFAPVVDRVAGQTRYETAAAITAAIHPPGAARLVVATGDNFPDALAAAPLRGPLLLLPGDGRWPSDALIGEARRLAASHVSVLGSGLVVPDLAVAALAGAPKPPASGRLLQRYFSTAIPGSPLTDAQGIPMTIYGGVPQYNPVQVSQFGLAHFERWLWTGAEENRSSFLRMADWLVATQKANGLWLYTFAFGGQPIPWWSGMAQGQAVSLLVRAYQATGNTAYLDRARLAIPTMRRTIANAGTASFAEGSYWIQEYLPPYSAYTLNGFMFSIAGLDDWVAVTGDATVAGWAAEAKRTLSLWLPRFDTGRWSLYNLSPPPGTSARGSTASLKYHVIHVVELRHFAWTTRDATLRTYAARWAAYVLDPPF